MNSDAPTATPTALRRSSQDRVLLGVCAGLAQTLELRPLLVRIGAILFGALAFPLLVIAYAAVALIVPRDDGRVLLGGEPHDGREQLLGWSTVLFAGVLLMASGLEPEQLVWPALDRGGLVLAAFGIAALVIREGRAAAAAPAVPGASAPGAPPAAPAPPAPTPTASTHADVESTATTVVHEVPVPSRRGPARLIARLRRGD
ncbi:PspC domain-containing protein [Conexibacter stalactiti]|uniref:PspC domain-containing protein n=1 Tax=Conexibacter stalactiti TaxID=1940611 RepID=A0ABU4HL00_9ACTN|nr:PspC domain-containing protein [Conexibacter stalactiti]MDW5593980.1 PspC domain-containing protein [Conexibacter stalactiti]MEC5034622.1 PspC domain-containing protein [Conexibacter stalactiti]